MFNSTQNQAAVGAEVSISDEDVEDDPLPGGYRGRGQEDRKDEEDSKRFKWDLYEKAMRKAI